MKKRLIILFFFPFSIAIGQIRSNPFYELYQLDSIGHSNSISRHFGSLYFEFLGLVEKKLTTSDTTVIRLVRHFEQVFARFYIDACEAYQQNQPIPHPAWRNYFANSSLSPSQYFLLGANAHLNGQLAEAIQKSYMPAEWRILKDQYVLFNWCLNKIYRKVYDLTLEESDHARLFHFISLGLDRPVGHFFLYKWRKRQMRLAEYFFAGSPRYESLSKKIGRQKETLDKLVMNNITSSRRLLSRTSREQAPQAGVNTQTIARGDGSFD